MSSSIRSRLLLLIMVSVGGVWSIAAVWSYFAAGHEIDEWDQGRMVLIARMLLPLGETDLIRLASTGIDMRNEYGPISRRVRDGDRRARFALVKVTERDGTIVAGTMGFDAVEKYRPANALPVAGEATAFTAAGVAWHSLTLRNAETGRELQLLLPALTNSDLATGGPGRIARPALITLPLLALLVWFSIGRSLKPLTSLSFAVRDRDASRLEPIAMSYVVREVRPLIDSINQLMARLAASLDRERAFTSEAAHELRTPLAAIKVQAQVALLAQDREALKTALDGVILGVDRSAHLAEQMLLLARLDDQRTVMLSDVELEALARVALVERSAEFAARSISTQVMGGSRQCIRTDANLVQIAINNLLDSALKYVQPGGTVAIKIVASSLAVSLEVLDDGPGVPDHERARLVDRFFRGANTKANGTGLGLSIVARVASSIGATVSFSDGLGGRGLSVCISFPS